MRENEKLIDLMIEQYYEEMASLGRIWKICMREFAPDCQNLKFSWGSDVGLYRELYEKIKVCFPAVYQKLMVMIEETGLSFSEIEMAELKELFERLDLACDDESIKGVIAIGNQEQEYDVFKNSIGGCCISGVDEGICLFKQLYAQEINDVKRYGNALKKYGVIDCEGEQVINYKFVESPQNIYYLTVSRFMDMLLQLSEGIICFKKLLLESGVLMKDCDEREVTDNVLAVKILFKQRNGNSQPGRNINYINVN